MTPLNLTGLLNNAQAFGGQYVQDTCVELVKTNNAIITATNNVYSFIQFIIIIIIILFGLIFYELNQLRKSKKVE